MKNIAIFASGSGSNAENIINYFKNNDQVNISIILTNKKDAFVIERAKKHNIEHRVFNRTDFYETDLILDLLKNKKIDLIVLAGFLWLVPKNLISEYNNKIINIHPALLPNYGGKGMYGMNVHKAVKENNETESGITVHFVDELYDNGEYILQEKCSITNNDTPEDIANKIHELEYKYFPIAIEKVLK